MNQEVTTADNTDSVPGNAEQQAATDVRSETALEVGPNLGLILDIPVKLSLEVGSTEQTVEQVLALAEGAVIELNRKAGEPLDVKVNGTLIARGEVVESQGKYGIRVIDVVSTSERISKLT